MHPTTVRNFILKGLSITYLWAFASLYRQIPGLYGDEGIAPVRSRMLCEGPVADCAFFGQNPSATYLFRQLHLSPMESMELACIIGMLVAGLSFTFVFLRNPVSYLIMWYMYASLAQVGGDFLHFQWDSLLSEAGFLAVLLAPISFLRWPSVRWLPQDNVALFLFRWLAFRLMFTSGVVKLLGQDPSWWKLTALHYHFASQCIPTPLAWYAHQLPDSLKQFSVIATFGILIFLSFFMLAPSKHMRYIGFAGQTLLMVLIALTGNYNFFNFLSVVLCASCLVDSSYSSVGTHKLKARLKGCYGILRVLVITSSLITLSVVCSKWFSVERLRSGSLNFSLKLDPAAFHSNLTLYYPYVFLLGMALFASEVIAAVMRGVKDFKKEKPLKRTVYFIQLAWVCFIATALFAVSLVPMTFIDRFTWEKMPEGLRKVHEKTTKFQMFNSYGLFQSMTGVGGRPEVVIQAFVNDTWVDYEFLYKPGDVSRRPPVVAPHQPRLDWQMWFAALSTYDRSPWFLSLIYRLLSNSEPVVDLLGKSPIQGNPARIRAMLYTYKYTLWNDRPKNWWSREEKSEFLGSFSVENESLVRFLKTNGYLVDRDKGEPFDNMGTRILASMRRFSGYFDGVQFVYAVTFTLLSPVVLPKFMGKKLRV